MARTAEAIPGDPHDNEIVWFLLGVIYERQKLYDRAETEFKKTLGVNLLNGPYVATTTATCSAISASVSMKRKR